jgi:hypothetical protein
MRGILSITVLVVLGVQPAVSQDVLTKVKRVAEKAVSKGRDYSDWLLVESDPAPDGYTVSEAQLTLEGPAACGSTAQCIEGERSPKQSSWVFRIQTHAGAPGVIPLEAVLTTKYRKIGTDASYTLIKKTPERLSSRGHFLGCFTASSENSVPANAGPWCTISADPPKAGYRIKSATFSLAGDRACSGNDFDPEEGDESAECRLTKRTDSEVVWEFKMLGHTENGPEAAGKSFGELRTVYEKIQ